MCVCDYVCVCLWCVCLWCVCVCGMCVLDNYSSARFSLQYDDFTAYMSI